MPPPDLVATELDLDRWLIDFGLAEDDETALFAGYCDRLAAAGVPLTRAAFGSDLLHPVLDARGFTWRPGEAVTREDYPRQPVPPTMEDFQSSPFYWLIQNPGEEIRRRLERGEGRNEFPLLDRFAREGMTDYLALAVRFPPTATLGSVSGLLCSWQTDAPGGFGDEIADLLRRVSRSLALAYKAVASVHTGRTLMRTYLGEDAGRRVLAGDIERGKAETIQAVLWYSDLEGFTRIADSSASDGLLGLLNDYAETVVDVVQDHGGEVMKFIGDGILAIFPLTEDVCSRALNAAQSLLPAVDALTARRTGEGLPSTGIHVAMHVGEVLYGNIGSRDRLDFTVVGRAVNEVARIEAMCRSLEQRLIVSEAFAASAGAARERLVSLGRYALRGVRRPEELFTLDLER